MTRSHFQSFCVALSALAMTLSACGVMQEVTRPTVPVGIVYGSEKREWLEPLVARFNEEGHQTPDGATIVIDATPMGSIESVEGILEGRIQPVVWSPASSVYIPVANAEWRQRYGDDLVQGTPEDLVLSPVVIAMWKPMAEALGWPDNPLGWADIAALATAPEGWEAYGYPEWGGFKFGHTHPRFSNSGVVSILAQVYAATEKQRDLTVADVDDSATAAFLQAVQESIIHYGSSTGFFAERMFTNGPSYLSAAVMYENLVVAQEAKRLTGQVSQVPVVAIYPEEGTFWTNNPYITLNAPWVTEQQKAAAEIFEEFLLDRPQQLQALEYGFRPADASIPLTAPLDAQHGVDPTQPQTILEVPSADVIRATEELWRQVKKPVDIVVVMDVSGSMEGEKISAARSSLAEFLGRLDDRDSVQVTLFNNFLTTISPLSEMGGKRDDLIRRVSGVIEGGDTALYDAVLSAHSELSAAGNPSHIRAIVLLSDGQDTYSSQSLDDALAAIGRTSEEGGNAIKVFTIAFGEDADVEVLRRIAEASGGKGYTSDPGTIGQVYAEIATFF